MKKILIYALIALMGGSLSSCKQEVMFYDGPESVYFSVRVGTVADAVNPDLQWPYYDYTTINLLLVRGDPYICNIKMAVTGRVKDYDRVINIAVDTDSTTAVAGDYDMPTSATVKAGELFAYIPVTIYRTPKLYNQDIKIGLKLLPSNDFAPIFAIFDQPTSLVNSAGAIGDQYPIKKQFDNSRHQIRVSAKLTRPTVWIGEAPNNGTVEWGYFGGYSDKKMSLILQVLDVEYADFLDATIMTWPRRAELGGQFAAYLLAEYRAGRAVTEDPSAPGENNVTRLMWANGVPWSSIKGQAWDGTYNPNY